jgi:hypothetical protein
MLSEGVPDGLELSFDSSSPAGSRLEAGSGAATLGSGVSSASSRGPVDSGSDSKYAG